MGKKKFVPQHLSLKGTQIETWFEHDRAHVCLANKFDDQTIIEWWDEAVQEAVEDGFLKPGDWHESAYEYALSIGAVLPPYNGNDCYLDTKWTKKNGTIKLMLKAPDGTTLVDADAHEIAKMIKSGYTTEDEWLDLLVEFATEEVGSVVDR